MEKFPPKNLENFPLWLLWTINTVRKKLKVNKMQHYGSQFPFRKECHEVEQFSTRGTNNVFGLFADNNVFASWKFNLGCAAFIIFSYEKYLDSQWMKITIEEVRWNGRRNETGRYILYVTTSWRSLTHQVNKIFFILMINYLLNCNSYNMAIYKIQNIRYSENIRHVLLVTVN